MRALVVISLLALIGIALLHTHPPARMSTVAVASRPVQPTQPSGAREISNLIRKRVSVRLHEIDGDTWYTLGRCVALGPLDLRFRCAIWSQGMFRSQDFWQSVIDVRCQDSLTECAWRARRDFAGPWKGVTR